LSSASFQDKEVINSVKDTAKSCLVQLSPPIAPHPRPIILEDEGGVLLDDDASMAVSDPDPPEYNDLVKLMEQINQADQRYMAYSRDFERDLANIHNMDIMNADNHQAIEAAYSRFDETYTMSLKEDKRSKSDGV